MCMCHSTYKMCFLMAEQQNALASWICKAAPFVTVAWGLRRSCVQELGHTNPSALPLLQAMESKFLHFWLLRFNKQKNLNGRFNFYCCWGQLQTIKFVVWVLLVSQGKRSAFAHSKQFCFQIHTPSCCCWPLLLEQGNNKACCKETTCFPLG